mmetsp:Transcript_2886/g.7930  ORF Transcript_2886/g.7930 Transcript_2886/m.7930 type:complete len:225 (-) Transcript_2886:458-1132(-)
MCGRGHSGIEDGGFEAGWCLLGRLVASHVQLLLYLGGIQVVQSVSDDLRHIVVVTSGSGFEPLSQSRYGSHISAGFFPVRIFVEHALVGLGMKQELVELLAPHDGVHGHRRGRSDGADGIDLLGFLCDTFVAGYPGILVDDRDLTEVPRRSGLDQGDVSGQTQAIDTAACLYVVQGVYNKIEFLYEGNVELGRITHIPVMRLVRNIGNFVDAGRICGRIVVGRG